MAILFTFHTSAAAWIDFSPEADPFTNSAIDLRFLNEKFAGEQGRIAAQDGRFVHSMSGDPVRLWAVNGPPHSATAPEEIRRAARLLAKRGVNLVRRHGAVFDKDGEVDMRKVGHAIATVEEMKAEGIYTHFSIYFPLWFTPRPDHPWLEGYDGKQHPFAALMFNPQFQKKYQSWWKALLLTPNPATGRPLIDDPAVFALEIQNEDSFFFWTFADRNIPEPQLRILEKQFGDWLGTKYGSIPDALKAWNSPALPRDLPAEGRAAFRPLWNMVNEKTARDRDTTAFLLDAQTRFYAETTEFLRSLGFKGLIHASNWYTASPELLGPLEKLSYTTGDFMDRHGYFGCNHKGENAAWSIRPGHTYSDRSALRFDPEEPGKPKQFIHPVMDPQYNDLPSMISETTFTRPNRFRSEAPLYFAAYGALQESDAIVHFAFDGIDWNVKPGFWMQQWTLMSPAMMGQFPAAALIFRRGLVQPGALLADIRLNKTRLRELEGTPLPQDASFDELRLSDVPQDLDLKPGQRLDPLIHYAGRTRVEFTSEPSRARLEDLAPFIDREKQIVTSSTGELELDFKHGLLRINAPRAQGAVGALHNASPIRLDDLTLTSELDLAQFIAVALDDKPLAQSSRILLQVMSEEQTSGFQTEPAGPGMKRITSIGQNPWAFAPLDGTVRFHRPDAAQLKVTALDHNGYPKNSAGSAAEIALNPGTLYYLITPGGL